jgi:hypothetical protein
MFNIFFGRVIVPQHFDVHVMDVYLLVSINAGDIGFSSFLLLGFQS